MPIWSYRRAMAHSLGSFWYTGFVDPPTPIAPESMDDYLKQMSALQLTDYIQQVKGASILFQDGNPDQYVSQSQAEAFFAAANPTKEIKIYDGVGHAMDSKQIMTDRDDWLTSELSLGTKP